MRLPSLEKSNISGSSPTSMLRTDLQLADVDHVHALAVAGDHEDLAAVGRKLHVARAFAGGDGLDDLEALAIEHGHRVVVLAADEQVAGVLGKRGAGAQAKAQERGERADRGLRS